MIDDSPLIIALDFPDVRHTDAFLERIQGQTYNLKVGLELFTSAGPDLIKRLVKQGHRVFLDLKLHDIPNTVAAACKAASDLGVWMITLHASGGSDMLHAARDAMASGKRATQLIAVTLLTSSDQRQLNSIGLRQAPQDYVSRLADLALQAHLHGIVCAAHEAQTVRTKWGMRPIIITPGIRLSDARADDQSRIASPRQARQCGASYMVIGRPLTRAPDPLMAMRRHLVDWHAGTAGQHRA